MSRARPSSRSRTNSALRSSSAIVVIRLFAAPSEASSCCSALSSASSRSIATSRLAAKHSTPPRTLCARLSPSRSGLGLAPALLPLGRLGGFFSPPEGEQLPAQSVALALRLFAPATLLGHPLAQCGLRYLATDSLGTELIPGLLGCRVGLCPLRRILDRLGVLWGLLRGFYGRDPL